MIPVVFLLAICCLHPLVQGDKASRKCAIINDRLDCKERGLDRIPSMQNADKFKEVDLSHNKITQLKSKAFKKFGSLRTLSLSQNMMVDIKDDAFIGLSKLRVLDISGNQLTKFDTQHLAPLVSLRTLAIHNNKFHCDCSFESLVKLIKKSKRKGRKYSIPKVHQIKCLGPKLLKGKPLVSLKTDQLCDVNECETSSHGCSKFASCINTGGSYKCACKKGFTGNGKKCRDVDECAVVHRHKCDPHRAFCANTDGSYKCFCRYGFEKKSGRCHDVDECTAGLHKCGSHAVCSNNVGSYRCACQDGYQGDGYTCVKAKVAEQSGIGPLYVAFGLGVMVLWPILLLSAYYWKKKHRQAQKKKGRKMKKTEKRRHFGKFLLRRGDFERGDSNEVVVYDAKKSKAGAKNSKHPKTTGSTWYSFHDENSSENELVSLSSLPPSPR